MWKPRAEVRRALANLLGLDPELVLALDAHSTPEPLVMAWQLLSCMLSIATVALTCALLLATCGLSVALALAGAAFAALCTLTLMRLVHACAGLGSVLNEELLTPFRRPALVPVGLLILVACTLSQAVCAAALDDELSLASAWQQHPVLAVLVTILVAGAIAAPGVLRVALPEAARTFEHAQRGIIERRVASQRDTCAELCDSLLAYELDRLDALQPQT